MRWLVILYCRSADLAYTVTSLPVQIVGDPVTASRTIVIMEPFCFSTDSALYKQVKDEALVSQSQKSHDFDDDEFGDIDDMLSPHGTG